MGFNLDCFQSNQIFIDLLRLLYLMVGTVNFNGTENVKIYSKDVL